MIGIGALVAIGAYTAIRGRLRLSRFDYVCDLIGLACALACLAMQVVG